MSSNSKPEDYDARSRLPIETLAVFSAIAFAYNRAENIIHYAIAISLRTKFPFPELTSRINGIDGLIELLKATLRINGLLPEVQASIAETLGEAGFGQIKKRRDDILHSLA